MALGLSPDKRTNQQPSPHSNSDSLPELEPIDRSSPKASPQTAPELMEEDSEWTYVHKSSPSSSAAATAATSNSLQLYNMHQSPINKDDNPKPAKRHCGPKQAFRGRRRRSLTSSALRAIKFQVSPFGLLPEALQDYQLD